MPCPIYNQSASIWQRIRRTLSPYLFRRKKIDKTHLQAILEMTVDAIITIDEACVILAFNQAAERMFGYEKEEVLGKNVHLLMPEPYHQEHDSYVQNYLRTGEKKIIGIGREVLAKRKDATIFPIDLSVSEVVVDGHRFFTGIIRDLSEKKELEAVKLTNIRIEAEMKARNDFVRMVSHELRTPLHAIMGFTECLINQIDGPLNEAQMKSLQYTYNASQHLLQLVNGILELFQISFQKQQLTKIKCDLLAIMDASFEIVHPLAEQKKIQLKKTSNVTSITVESNPKHIKEIFINLLGNAIKFTNQGEVSCSMTQEGKRVKIVFKDTGIGMTPENLHKIFTPFTRFDTEKSGVGLGLAITKQLVGLYEGTIEVESQKGVGTVFTVYLPLFEKRAQAQDG